MSSISSATSLNFNPFRLLALLDSQSASGTSTTTPSTNTTGATTTTGTTATGSTSLWNQLTTAFNTALQNAEQTGNTSNLASVLQTAGNQVLQNNGINPTTFEQEAAAGQTQGSHHHHHHHGGSSSASSSASQSSDAGSPTTGATSSSDATTPAGGTTTTTATQETSDQQFANWLTQILGSLGGSQSITGSMLNQYA